MARSQRGLWLIGIAIVLTALNLRTAVNSVGPVLQELEEGLHLSSGLAGLVTALPVLCFAVLGFAGPPLSARYRDSHVLAGAMATMTAGLVLRGVAGTFSALPRRHRAGHDRGSRSATCCCPAWSSATSRTAPACWWARTAPP